MMRPALFKRQTKTDDYWGKVRKWQLFVRRQSQFLEEAFEAEYCIVFDTHNRGIDIIVESGLTHAQTQGPVAPSGAVREAHPEQISVSLVIDDGLARIEMAELARVRPQGGCCNELGRCKLLAGLPAQPSQFRPSSSAFRR